MLQVHTAAEAIAIVVKRVQAELPETPDGF
jgi:hypothetical protein